MTIKKILYISDSIGLGHVSKDLAIAQKLRMINPGVKIIWLASHPADVVLKKKGEYLHPSSEQFSSYSAPAERAAKGSHLNLVNYVLSSVNGWRKNVNIFKQIIKKEHFDLVVSDIEMPRMNGFDLVASIRSDNRTADLPVILVTALESREDRERGIDVGANAYIVKRSFDQSNLLDVIRKLI